jgi:ELWxxDGT repeat protein
MKKLLLLLFITHVSLGQISLVKDLNVGPGYNGLQDAFYGNKLVKFGDYLYFGGNADGFLGLFRTDGTDAGTTRLTSPTMQVFVKEIQATPTFVAWSAGNYIASGEVPWRYDGTTADIAAYYGNYAQSLAVYNGEVFYAGHTFDDGFELWKIDATNLAVKVKNIPGTGVGQTLTPSNILAHSDGFMYFLRWRLNADCELWKSDGTTGGTNMVKALPYITNMYSAGSKLYLFGPSDPNYPTSGNHNLWVSDGTTGGTIPIKDFNPADYPTHSDPYAFNGKLYFVLDDKISGSELWTSDGTTLGTYRVADINPGIGNGFGTPLGHVGSTLYLAGNDGTGTALYKMDAATETVTKIKTISFITKGIEFQGKFYFAADDGVNGQELWVSDGTNAGTLMVGDINATGSSYPIQFCVLNNKLIFDAYTDALGYELYKYIDPLAPTCPQNLVLSGVPAQADFSASESIISTQIVNIPSPQTNYLAPSITLSPGFRVESGSVFSAIPDGCI